MPLELVWTLVLAPLGGPSRRCPRSPYCIGSLATLTYGFLGLAGAPQLSWFFVWPSGSRSPGKP